MIAWRLRLRALSGDELLTAVIAGTLVALVSFAAAHKLGMVGLFVPLVLLVAFYLLLRPILAVSLAVGMAILCEGEDFGLFTFTSKLYVGLYKSLGPLDGLVLLAVVSIAVDLLRSGRRPQLPLALAFPLSLLFLAMIAGAATGHGAGISLRSVVLAENVFLYLVLLPIAITNLDIEREQVTLLLKCLVGLAILKGLLGLIELAAGLGPSIDSSTSLTYYEPTANWLIMIVLLGLFAALITRVRPPLWMLLGSPLLIGSLLLSYRRSFWIGTVLGLLLVLILAISPSGRRLLIPVALLMAVAIWFLGTVNFQSQSPLVKRAASLNPSSLQTNAEDRYRLDERANVLGEIRRHPLTGLGMLVPWEAVVQPLSLEHPGGRLYVHFDVLYLWLKLGILGIIAYFSLLIGSAIVAWRVWRRSREPLLRFFALASLCGFASLVVIETTASFTGVDLRFTVMLGAQIGLLGLLSRSVRARGAQSPDARARGHRNAGARGLQSPDPYGFSA